MSQNPIAGDERGARLIGDKDKADLIARERSDLRQEMILHESALLRVAFVWLASVASFIGVVVTNSSSSAAAASKGAAVSTTLPTSATEADSSSFLRVISRHRGEVVILLSQFTIFLSMVAALLLLKMAIVGGYIELLENKLNALAREQITAYECGFVHTFISSVRSAYSIGCFLVAVAILLGLVSFVFIHDVDPGLRWVIIVELVIVVAFLVLGLVTRKRAVTRFSWFVTENADSSRGTST